MTANRRRAVLFTSPLLVVFLALLLAWPLPSKAIDEDTPLAVEVEIGTWKRSCLTRNFTPKYKVLLPVATHKKNCHLMFKPEIQEPSDFASEGTWQCEYYEESCKQGIAVTLDSDIKAPAKLSYMRFGRMPPKANFVICPGTDVEVGKVVGRPAFFYSEEEVQTAVGTFHGLKLRVRQKPRRVDWVDKFEYGLKVKEYGPEYDFRAGDPEIYWSQEVEKELSKGIAALKVDGLEMKHRYDQAPVRTELDPVFVPREAGGSPTIWFLHYGVPPSDSTQQARFYLTIAPFDRSLKPGDSGVAFGPVGSEIGMWSLWTKQGVTPTTVILRQGHWGAISGPDMFVFKGTAELTFRFSGRSFHQSKKGYF